MQSQVEAKFSIEVDNDNGLGTLIANDVPMPESESVMLMALCGEAPFTLDVFLSATHWYVPKTHMEPAEDSIDDELVTGVRHFNDTWLSGRDMKDSGIKKMLAIQTIADMIDQAKIEAEWEPVGRLDND